MLDVLPQDPVAFAELRVEAGSLARLQVARDTCTEIGWQLGEGTGLYVHVYFRDAAALGISEADARQVLVEEGRREADAFEAVVVQSESTESMDPVATYLTDLCPTISARFPKTIVADGDEPVDNAAFRARLIVRARGTELEGLAIR